RVPSYVYCTLGMAMFTFALGGLQLWTPDYLSTELANGKPGMDLQAANMGLGVAVVISGLVGTPLGSWLADRLSRKRKGAYFWLSGVAMLVSGPCILVALLVARQGGADAIIFTFIATSLILAFINYGPSNAILINV